MIVPAIEQQRPLAEQIAKRFIQRRDVKAQQGSGGIYYPVRTKEGQELPWQLADILNHLNGSHTFGHYLLDQSDQTKLFAFDLDLNKTGSWWSEDGLTKTDFNPRADFQDRAHPGRNYLKQQMRVFSNELARAITELFPGMPTAMAFTGAKGMHVYGFTGSVPAADAREAANLVLEHMGCWEPSRGKAFFRRVQGGPDDWNASDNFTLEVFPKQDSLDGKDGLGNLMRLPMGRNLKAPNNPCFFIDATQPYGVLAPHPDPIRLLRDGDPWV